MTHGRADAVRPGVAAADDHHVFALSGNITPILLTIEKGLGICMKKLHGEVDALQISPFNRKITGLGGARAKDHRSKFFEEFVRGIIFSDFRVGDKLHPFLRHQVDPPLHDRIFIELHVGNSIHEQAADAIRTFEHSH